MKKSRRAILWGCILLVAAALIIGGQFASFASISVWTIIASILLVVIFVESLLNFNYIFMLLVIAVLYILYRQPLGLPDVGIGYLILGALLGGLGLTLMFKPKPPKNVYFSDERPITIIDGSESDNQPVARVSFSAGSRYLHAAALQNCRLTASFGALQVYFEEATLAGPRADVLIDCSFGAVKLYVPRDWQVVDNLRTAIGGVSNNVRNSTAGEGAPQLVLSGNVNFGAVEVYYV